MKPPLATTMPSPPVPLPVIARRLTAFESTVASAPTTIPGPVVAILLPTTSSDAAGRDGAGRDDAALVAGEHLVPLDAARVEIGRAAAEVDRAVEPEDDVVLDAQSGREDAELVAVPGVDADSSDEHVASQRGEQRDALELDRDARHRRARVVRAGIREDGEILQRRRRRPCAASPPRARPRR